MRDHSLYYKYCILNHHDYLKLTNSKILSQKDYTKIYKKIDSTLITKHNIEEIYNQYRDVYNKCVDTDYKLEPYESINCEKTRCLWCEMPLCGCYQKAAVDTLKIMYSYDIMQCTHCGKIKIPKKIRPKQYETKYNTNDYFKSFLDKNLVKITIILESNYISLSQLVELNEIFETEFAEYKRNCYVNFWKEKLNIREHISPFDLESKIKEHLVNIGVVGFHYDFDDAKRYFLKNNLNSINVYYKTFKFLEISGYNTDIRLYEKVCKNIKTLIKRYQPIWEEVSNAIENFVDKDKEFKLVCLCERKRKCKCSLFQYDKNTDTWFRKTHKGTEFIESKHGPPGFQYLKGFKTKHWYELFPNQKIP